MNEILNRSAVLVDELLDSLSDEEFLKIHDSLEFEGGPTVDEFLKRSSLYEHMRSSVADFPFIPEVGCVISGGYQRHASLSTGFSLSGELKVLTVDIKNSTELYAANDYPYDCTYQTAA